MAKTSTDFMCVSLTCLQQDYLASFTRADAELTWVWLAAWCHESGEGRDLSAQTADLFSFFAHEMLCQQRNLSALS